MRVLLVHNRYRFVGGEERHVDLLEESLVQTGVRVRRLELVSSDSLGLWDRLRIGSTLTYRPAGARALREALAEERADVVHFHNLFPLLTPAAVREARLHGAHTVLTVHNYRFACPGGTLLRRGVVHDDCIEGSSLLCGLRNSRGVWSESIAYGVALQLQRWFRLLHRWVDAFVTPSYFVGTILARAGYPSDRIHTIYNSTVIDDTPRAQGDFALYAGRLVREKGIETLLASLRVSSDVPLVIAGTGPLAGIVEDAAGDRLTYCGQLDSQSVAELRRRSLFTVVPSEWLEVQPFAVIESMAAGKPVIASRLGGLSEIVEDGVTGVLVPPHDPRALARAMDSLWRDPARAAAMGDRALRYAGAHFSPSTQTKRLIQLYEKLIADGR